MGISHALTRDWFSQASLAQACTAFKPLLLSHTVEVRVYLTQQSPTAILALNSCLKKGSNTIEHLTVLKDYQNDLTWQHSHPPSVVQAQVPAYR